MDLHDLGITPILQETCVTCGSAVARMVLGVRSPSEPDLAQRVSSFMQRSRNPCFFTSPEALVDVLERATGRDFRVERRDNIGEVNKLIVNVLLDRRVPVPVLVHRCLHWIVASGFVSMGVEGDVAVSTFIIDDPFNPCLDCDRDGIVTPLCRTGRFTGLFVEEVPAMEWRERWLTACNCQAEQQIVCIVPADAIDGPRRVSEFLPVDPGPPGLIAPATIEDLDICLDWAKDTYRLDTHPTFEGSLREARVRRAKVVKSERGDYFLAEVGRHAGVSALFLFDRARGTLISARALGEQIDHFLPTAGEIQEGILEWRARNDVEIPFEEAISESTPLTWNPSREFRSPYFPYFSVGQGEDHVVVGVNGALYRGDLHTAQA